ncbi:MAG: glycoside hydrolase family 5 protein [Promethearchaeota archaeon]
MLLLNIRNTSILILFILGINCIFTIGYAHNDSSVNNLEPKNYLQGVNLGNALEAPREGAWGVTLKEFYFQSIKEAGFSLIRIPIRWNAHAKVAAPYTIETEFFNRIDWAVNHSLSRGLVTIINIHHYEALMTNPQAHKERFLALWHQISTHYQNYSENLYFELLNEPTYDLNGSLWNQYLQEAIEIVRELNPQRTIIIGPTNWNNIYDLSMLSLPEDDHNILVTFHYYSPFHFTHQDAKWVSGSDQWSGTTWNGTDSEKAAIRQDLDYAAQWAKDHNRPLLLGEFGAYQEADMDSRVRWTDFVAREAEKRNISWAYWEFCSGFGIFKLGNNKWRIELLQALLPESPILPTTKSKSTSSILTTSKSSSISMTSTTDSTMNTTNNTGFLFSLITVLFSTIIYRKRK